MTGIGKTLILGQHDHLHHLGKPWTFHYTLSSQTVKSDGRIKTLLSLVDPVRATIYIVPESFQLQMGFSFSFLRTNALRSYLFIMRTHSFYSLVCRGTYARLVYSWYQNIFLVIAVLIVFHVVNEKNRIQKY